MSDAPKVRRVLHMRFTFASANPKELFSMLESAMRFMEFFGGKAIQLLQNADDPARFIQVIEYEAQEDLEKKAARCLRATPDSRPFLQAWRTMLPGGVEIDIYQDVAHL